MPLSEVVNALFITYIATEYSLQSSRSNSAPSLWTNKTNLSLCGAVVIINLVDRLVGAADMLKDFMEQLMHMPKVLLAAVLYLVVLYVDCRNHAAYELTWRRFLGHVLRQFCRILPLYPFLAVLISFGFMFVVELFEHLHLPLQWLQMPIYYGTLYGPFSLTYLQVKRKIVEQEHYSLPQTSRRLPAEFLDQLDAEKRKSRP